MSPVFQADSRRAAHAARLLVLLSPLGIDLYLPALPAISQELGSQATLSLSVYLAALGLGQLGFGPLSDRLGRRRVALAGTLLFALSSVLLFFTGSLAGLLVWRLLQGLAASAASVCAMAVVRDRFSGAEAAREYGVLGGVLNVVPFAAPLLGSVLLQWFDWRSGFAVLAALGALVSLALWWRMPETAPKREAGQVSSTPWRHPVFLGFVLCCALSLAVILSYVTLAPRALMSEAGLSPLAFGGLFAANALLISGSCLGFARLSARIGAVKVLQLALGLLGVGAGLLLLSGVPGGVASFMLPVAVISVAFGGITGPASSLAMQPFAQNSGAAAAWLGCLQMLIASLISGGLSLLALPVHLLLGGLGLAVSLLCLAVVIALQRRHGTAVLQG